MSSLKPSSPRIYRRSGMPLAWFLMSSPRRTYPGDSGDVADLAGHLAAGVRDSGCSWATGPSGPCLTFGGASRTDFGTAAKITSGHLTVSCRVNPGTTGRGDPVTRWRTAADPGDQFDLLYGLTAGKPQLYISTASSFGTSGVGPTAMAVGTWYHVLGTYDGDVCSTYLNGVLQASASIGGPLRAATDDSGYVLGDGFTGGGSFTGLLDDVRIYDYALTPAQVRREFADPYWRLRPPPRKAMWPASTPTPTPTASPAALLACL